MRIFGIDPGMAIVGYSILDIDGDKYKLVASGSIQTSKKLSESARLLEIFKDMKELINTYEPDVASVEKLFFFKNQKTIMPVSQARGVILTVLEMLEVPMFEYTPLVVKQVLTGYGRASKDEVANLVTLALKGQTMPKLDDTVDAIAIAICHARSAESLEKLRVNQ